MKKIILLSLFASLVLANDLNLLTDDKKELREVEKKILQENHKNLKNDWISPVNLSSSLNRSHSFSDENDTFNKSISIGFSQSIYESGGIEFTIQYADDKYRSDFLAWESENSQIFQTLYTILLQIKKLQIELRQSEYTLKNKEIELILKKIQYENGKTDITELNNAIMAKNTQYKQNINLENSLKEQKLELAKYTILPYEQIELIDFSDVSKKEYLEKNLELLYEKSLIQLADTNYKKTQTTYLPKLSLSTNLGYSQNDNLTSNIDSDSTAGSLALSLSMPLYDINKKSTLEQSRLELLKQKLSLSDLKNETINSFEETLTRIDTYKKYNTIIDENIKLYDDLISVNELSNSVGMSSDYDLEILKNTKIINQYDKEINNISIQQEYAGLYFNIRGNN